MLPKNNLEHKKELVSCGRFAGYDCTPDCPACAYEQGRKDEAARWLEHIEGQREKIAEIYIAEKSNLKTQLRLY